MELENKVTKLWCFCVLEVIISSSCPFWYIIEEDISISDGVNTDFEISSLFTCATLYRDLFNQLLVYSLLVTRQTKSEILSANSGLVALSVSLSFEFNILHCLTSCMLLFQCPALFFWCKESYTFLYSKMILYIIFFDSCNTWNYSDCMVLCRYKITIILIRCRCWLTSMAAIWYKLCKAE